MSNMNAFDLTVSALRDKGLSSDEILCVLSELFGGRTIVSMSGETPAQVQKNSLEILTDVQKENKLKDLFTKLGIPRHIDGCKYLIKAVMLYDKDPTQKIRNQLYPGVAEAFNTRWDRVERSMRRAIEHAWDRGDIEEIHKLFGHTVSASKGKPTNSEFIAMCAEWLNR